MAVHHGGFDLYDSSYTPWNSVDKPPDIDVMGELAKAARAKDMKFGATSHLAWNWHFFSANMYPDKFDAKEAPELYNLHSWEEGPSDAFVQEWYNRTTELIDKYELDFLWFDFGTQHPKFSNHYTAKDRTMLAVRYTMIWAGCSRSMISASHVRKMCFMPRSVGGGLILFA